VDEFVVPEQDLQRDGLAASRCVPTNKDVDALIAPPVAIGLADRRDLDPPVLITLALPTPRLSNLGFCVGHRFLPGAGLYADASLVWGIAMIIQHERTEGRVE
jgi:hypothetical protein